MLVELKVPEPVEPNTVVLELTLLEAHELLGLCSMIEGCVTPYYIGTIHSKVRCGLEAVLLKGVDIHV